MIGPMSIGVLAIVGIGAYFFLNKKATGGAGMAPRQGTATGYPAKPSTPSGAMPFAATPSLSPIILPGQMLPGSAAPAAAAPLDYDAIRAQFAPQSYSV